MTSFPGVPMMTSSPFVPTKRCGSSGAALTFAFLRIAGSAQGSEPFARSFFAIVIASSAPTSHAATNNTRHSSFVMSPTLIAAGVPALTARGDERRKRQVAVGLLQSPQPAVHCPITARLLDDDGVRPLRDVIRRVDRLERDAERVARRVLPLGRASREERRRRDLGPAGPGAQQAEREL